MKAVSLDAYSIGVRNRRDAKLLQLDKFNGKDSVILQVHSYLASIKTKFFTSVEDKRCLQIETLNNAGDTIEGLALVGQFGYSGRLVDHKSGVTNYNIKQTDVPLEPFYFEMAAKPAARKGILICAKHGQSGCKSLLSQYVRDEFSKRFPTYIMDIQPLMPKQAIDALVDKGRVNAVRFVQDVIPHDIADRFNGNQQAQEGEVEIVIRPKKTGKISINSIKALMLNQKTVKDLIQIKDFDPSNVKVELDVQGRKRVIDFGNLGHVRASFDVTAEVTAGVDGYPTFASVRTASKSLITSLLPSL